MSSAVGTPLDWPEAKKVADHVRQWGIEVRLRFSLVLAGILNFQQQLLAIWNRAKGKERDALLWGDEVW